jgi:hypothetical protein
MDPTQNTSQTPPGAPLEHATPTPGYLDLSGLLSLAHHPDWLPRLSGQLHIEGETGVRQWGSSVGGYDVADIHDVAGLTELIARRMGIGDDGHPRAIRVGLRATKVGGRQFSGYVLLTIERRLVEHILQESGIGAAKPTTRPDEWASSNNELQALRLELQALRSQPQRGSVVDANPFQLARDMMAMQADASAAMRKELRELLAERQPSTTPPAASTAAPDIMRALGRAEAGLEALKSLPAGEGSKTNWEAISTLGAPIVQSLSNILEKLVDQRAQEGQMRLALWAKQNQIPLQLVEDTKAVPPAGGTDG